MNATLKGGVKSLQLTTVLRRIKCSHSQENPEKALNSETTIPIIMNEPWKGFVFLDVNDDLLQECHDLGHCLTLRKATPDEIRERQVEGSLRMWSERQGTSMFLNQRMPRHGAGNASSPGSILTNPEEWRHAVIECSDSNIFFWNVNLANYQGM